MSQESETSTTEVEAGAIPEAQEAASPAATEGVSSSGTSADEPQTVRDSILAALADPAEEPAQPEPGKAPAAQAAERNSAPEAKPETDPGEDEEHRLTDEEFRSLPQGVRNRIGHLSTSLSKVRKERDDLSQKMEASSGAIQQMEQLESFVRENRIEPKNLSLAFGMMAKLANGDFSGFLSDIGPFVALAQQSAGLTYAADLKSAVENGEISEDMARRMTQERAQNARLLAQTQALQQTQKVQSAAQSAQATTSRIVQAVNAREAELRSDPEYARLAPLVQEQIKVMLESGARPRSPEEGVAMVNRAVEFVRRTAPKPQPKPTLPTPSATSNPRSAKPAPKSVREAVLLGLSD